MEKLKKILTKEKGYLIRSLNLRLRKADDQLRAIGHVLENLQGYFIIDYKKPVINFKKLNRLVKKTISYNKKLNKELWKGKSKQNKDQQTNGN